MKTYSVYLNGELKTTEKSYGVTNPANGEDVARMSTVDRPAVAQAIKDAHAAFIIKAFNFIRPNLFWQSRNKDLLFFFVNSWMCGLFMKIRFRHENPKKKRMKAEG